MLKSAEPGAVGLWSRIGLWFVCLPLAICLFSLLLSRFLLDGVGFGKLWFMLPIFRATMKCALPIWCLCLPVVVAVKQAQGWKMWTLLPVGSLIGPLAVGIWFLLLQVGGASPQPMWQGDPLMGWVGSAITGMIFALVIGVLTSSLYLIGFKILHRRLVRRSLVANVAQS
ncbi:MAG TPA: hypothetical protein VF126_07110 [Acidobacteriaceae bacterium]